MQFNAPRHVYVLCKWFPVCSSWVLINDLMTSPHLSDSWHTSDMVKYVLGRCQCPLAPHGSRPLCTCHVRERDTEKPFIGVDRASLHTSVGRTSGCHIKRLDSISICNLGNLLDVFKLLAIELLKGSCFWSASGTESLSLLRTRLFESSSFSISFDYFGVLFIQPSLVHIHLACF